MNSRRTAFRAVFITRVYVCIIFLPLQRLDFVFSTLTSLYGKIVKYDTITWNRRRENVRVKSKRRSLKTLKCFRMVKKKNQWISNTSWTIINNFSGRRRITAMVGGRRQESRKKKTVSSLFVHRRPARPSRRRLSPSFVGAGSCASEITNDGGSLQKKKLARMIQWKRKPFFGVEKNKKERKKSTSHVTPVPGEGDRRALCHRQSTIRPRKTYLRLVFWI